MKLSSFRKSSGFTLVELLIVIAVLGVLAAVVLVAINPLEQLAKGRDAGRKSSVAQIGSALQGYYTTNSAYPATATLSDTWLTNLVTSGELKIVPTNAAVGSYAPGCSGAVGGQSGFCYTTDGTDSIAYALLESKAAKSLCAATEIAWEVWSSADGKAGIVCTASTATPAVGTQTFVGN